MGQINYDANIKALGLTDGTTTKTMTEVLSSVGSGVSDVKINNTSIVSSNIANIITNTAYDSSSNKIATMSDLPPTITITTTSGSESVSDGTNTLTFGSNAFNSTSIPSVSLTTTTGSEAITVDSSSLNLVTRDTAQTITSEKTLSTGGAIVLTSGTGIKGNKLGSKFNILSNTWESSGMGGHLVTDIGSDPNDSNSYIRVNSSIAPAENTTVHLGQSYRRFNNIYGTYINGTNVAGNIIPTKIKSSTSSTYGLTIPETTSWTEDKTIATTTDIPTKTSDLTNDSGFITSSDIPQEIYYCTYGTTTFAQVTQAIADGKLPVCIYPGENNHKFVLVWSHFTGANYYYFSCAMPATTYSVYLTQDANWSQLQEEICERVSHKVTSISSSSTDAQYPSAKAVYDAIPSTSDCLKNNVNGTITGNSSDTPLTLKSKAAASYIGFKDTNGTALGYFGVNSSKKPVFYDTQDHQLAYLSDISSALTPSLVGTATSSSNKFRFTNVSFDGLGVFTFGNCTTIINLYGLQVGTYKQTGTFIYNSGGAVITTTINVVRPSGTTNVIEISSGNSSYSMVDGYTGYLFRVKLA